MSTVAERETEERLRTVGTGLLQPPASVDELLTLLDQTEEHLSKVEQSPVQSMQTALSPIMKALIRERLLRHSDVDVRAGVASCISEITRITAPDAPYNDDKMKDVFQLIVSSFENLADTSSRSHKKRATILETVAKVRSCVIMLDLECDQMIIEMFEHFLKAIRDDHAEVIFSSMETIMTLVLEESEDITPDLLNPILTTLKRINNEDVMPIAKKLAERVVQSCADKLRPYVTQAIRTLGASLDDYDEVVASLVCKNDVTDGHSHENTLKDQLVVEDGAKETNPRDKDFVGNRSPKSTVTNGVNETGTEETMTDANYTTKAEANNPIDGKLTFKNETDDLDAQIPVKLELEVEHATKTKGRQFNSNSDTEESSDHHVDEKQAEQGPRDQEISGEDVPSVPSEVPHVEPAISSDKVKGNSIQLSPSEAQDDEGVNVASPTCSDSLPEQSRSNKTGRAKRKEILVDEGAVSGDTAPEKVAGEIIAAAKKQRSSRKKQPEKKTIKAKALTVEVDCKNDGGSAGDSEKRSPDQAEKLDDAGNESDAGSPTRKGDGKKSGRSKYRSEKRSVDQTEKLDEAGNESDAGSPATKGDEKKSGRLRYRSEKRSLDQTEKLDDAGNESDAGSPARKGDGKKGGRLKFKPEKRSLDQTEKPDDAGNESDAGSPARKGDGKKSGRSKLKSEKRSLDQTEKLDDAGNESDAGSPAKKGDVKKSERSKYRSERKSLDQTEKLDDAGNESDGGSPVRKGDGKKSGRSKYRSDKDVLKSTTREDDGKDTVTSPRSPLKSTKDESDKEVTPRMSSKRKRTPGMEKASDTREYGKNLVGSKVRVWWPKDRMFYEGVIASFDSSKKKHKVSYADGDEEVLNLKKERWEFVGDHPVSDEGQDSEHSSRDASPDMPKKKKGTSSEAPSKHVKMDSSAKSKSKDTATKSGGKHKDADKAEANTKATNSKSSKKSEDDNIKSKDRLQKLGGKSHNDSAIDDVAKTPSHSKQDIQRTAKATGKTPQSAKTSGGPAKSGSSKAKETNKTKEKMVESTKSAEISKGKSPAATKSREIETKSAKKRKR